METAKSSHAAFLLPGWFLGLQDAHFQIFPIPKDRELISASCPAKSPGDRDCKQFKGNELTEASSSSAPGLTQLSGWQVFAQPKPPQGLNILFHAAAENLYQVCRARLEWLRQSLSPHPLCSIVIIRRMKEMLQIPGLWTKLGDRKGFGAT